MQSPSHVVTSTHNFETSLNVYPAIQLWQAPESVVEHVAHGKIQFMAQVCSEVIKNPGEHVKQVLPVVHSAQLAMHGLQVTFKR